MLFQCYTCQVAQKMKESCCLAFLGGEGEMGIMLMRAKARSVYGISVSTDTTYTVISRTSAPCNSHHVCCKYTSFYRGNRWGDYGTHALV